MAKLFLNILTYINWVEEKYNWSDHLVEVSLSLNIGIFPSVLEIIKNCRNIVFVEGLWVPLKAQTQGLHLLVRCVVYRRFPLFLFIKKNIYIPWPPPSESCRTEGPARTLWAGRGYRPGGSKLFPFGLTDKFSIAICRFFSTIFGNWKSILIIPWTGYRDPAKSSLSRAGRCAKEFPLNYNIYI